jgi:hypothetical protein
VGNLEEAAMARACALTSSTTPGALRTIALTVTVSTLTILEEGRLIWKRRLGSVALTATVSTLTMYTNSTKSTLTLLGEGWVIWKRRL